MTNEQLYLAEKVTAYIKENDYLSGRDMRTLAQLRESAVCADSPIGGYECYVEIVESRGPGFEPTVICVDTCIQHEIYELRKIHNVNTIGCCCGHGRAQAYIQVSPQSVQKMHELGYEQLPEQADGQGKWCFKPKTYFLQPVSRSYKLVANDLGADMRSTNCTKTATADEEREVLNVRAWLNNGADMRGTDDAS